MSNANRRGGKKNVAAAVAVLIDGVIRQYEEGQPVDREAIERENPDLMPLLGDRLRRLQQVYSAARQVKMLSADVPEDASSEFDDGLQFLQRALTGFEMLGRIDRGGQGRVYKAVQKSTKRTVAIKVLSDGPFATERQRARFSREIELVSRLRHPHIVTVYESGVVEGRPYFAMEYVDGLPLDDFALLEGQGVAERVRLFLNVCRAVGAAHLHGILHRDLKPANILVDDEGAPHILDFGLAKEIFEDLSGEAPKALSLPGQVVGTLHYLSPEQVSGFAHQVDVRSDVYSLGVVLYELVTGLLPYRDTKNQQALLHAIATETAPSMRSTLKQAGGNGTITAADIDGDLERIVDKALDKDRDGRYQSVADVADDLERYLAGDVVEARASSGLYIFKRTIRRYRVHLTVAVSFVLLLVAALVVTVVLYRRANEIAQIAQTGMQMAGFTRQGYGYQDRGRQDQAIAAYEKAIELGRYVPKTNELVFRQMLVAHYELALAYRKKGDDEAAARNSDALVALTDDLLRLYGDDQEALRWSGYAHRSVADRHRSRDRLEDAVRMYHKSTELFERALDCDPADAYTRHQCAAALGIEGWALDRAGRVNEARDLLTKARAIAKRLASEQPDDVEYVLEYCASLGRLVNWHDRRLNLADDIKAVVLLDALASRLRALEVDESSASYGTYTQSLETLETQKANVDEHIWAHLEAGPR